MHPTPRRFFALGLIAAALFASPALRAAVNLALSQSTVDNAFSGTITLTVTGLPSSGQTVLVEKFADLNNNGTIDGSDILVRSFTVTDGTVPSIGGHRNTNVPGDDDGAADSQVTINLAQPGIDDVFGAMVGSYIYRVSDATGSTFTPATHAFAVTAQSLPQGVQGQITALTGGAPIPGAMIVLLDGNGNAITGIIADGTGNYHLPTVAGSYNVIAIAPGFVTDMSTASATVSASAFTTLNEALATGTSTISGQVTNSTNSNPVAGLFVVSQSSDNHITGGFTNSSGNYSLSTSAAQWQLDQIDGQLAQHGFVKPQDKSSADTTSGNKTVNLALTPANALIYGTVTDGTNPLAGISVGGNDQANLYSSSGLSAPTTGAYSMAVVAGTWNGGLSTDHLPAGYFAGTGFNVTLSAGQAVQENLVAQLVTAHLQGTVTNLGSPVSNVEVVAYQQSGQGGNINITTMTDGSGNFDLGVVGGSWHVAVDSSSTNPNNLVTSNLPETIADNQTISGIALQVKSGTGTISGTVKDLSGNPVSNAIVFGSVTISNVLYSANGQTDDTGAYSFPVIAGSWTVTVSANNLTYNNKFPVVTSSATVNFVPTVITQQPQPQTVPTLSPASFSIQTNAPGSPTFQWQVSTNGGSVWTNLANTAPYSGVTTTTLAISSVSNAMNTYRYRCVVTFTGVPGVENSSGGLLTVNPTPPNFTQQPTPHTVSQGQGTSFTAQVNDGAATFQWQVSVNGGTSWTNLANDSTYGGATTGTLTITNPTGVLNGNQYRVVATDVVSSTSAAVTLTVHSAAADFNGDGQSDLVWQDMVTGERYIWLMNGTAFNSSVSLGVIASDWEIAATGDLNGDGQTDLVWQNTLTGGRQIWLMNGTAFSSGVALPTISTDWSIVGTGDFNGDGKADLVWENTVTGERLIWLMNGTAFSSSVSLGTVPTEWEIGGVADFTGDGKPDLLFSNLRTGQLVAWIMNGTAYTGNIPLGTVSPQSQLAGVGDFNGDGKADILWSNRLTGVRSVQFMNGTTAAGTAQVTILSTDWTLNRPLHRRVPADFNNDHHSDLLWQNTSTGDRLVWLMNGTTYVSTAALGNIPTAWSIAGSGDFNGDGQNDLVWQNSATGDRVIWLMNGTSYSSTIPLGTIATAWSIAAVGDFDGDGHPDLLWQNTTTGDRLVWLMNGTGYSTTVMLGNLSTAWSIGACADFNLDGSTDILWQNTSTGQRAIWLMNGTSYSSTVSLGTVATAWSVVGTGDFNGDGFSDVVWQNTSTGDRFVWLMNGTTYVSGVSLGNVPVAWSIRN